MISRYSKGGLILFCFLFSGWAQLAYGQGNKRSLADLKQGEKIDGFSAEAVYLNDAGQPMGGRFIHQGTGFTLDLLQIESVPQTFIWVNTFPVSDKGEPHTQEHLLVTKGNKGHELNTRTEMSLSTFNAFTNQLYTAYDFYTGADAGTFYTLFDKYLDALLYPDYSNEEVSREVRNWGVTENADHSLRLEEKGSVYNEMSTSMNNPYAIMFNRIGRLLYGSSHPLSFNAGGLPSGIRELNAADIHRYHDDHYYLGNMGAIVSLSKKVQLETVLVRINGILNQLSRQAVKRVRTKQVLPPPHPAPSGEIVMCDFPSGNAGQPGSMMLAWPATRQLNAQEDVMISNFLQVFAGDATTNLYRLFVNSATRIKDFDAQGIFGYMDNNEGQPVMIGLAGIQSENLTKDKAQLVREAIHSELERIAGFKDHSKELLEFNSRFKNSLTSIGRSFSKFVNSPPKFGFRNTVGQWYDQLQELNKVKGFTKSVILKPQFLQIEKELASGKNIWKTYLDRWQLLSAVPYVIVSKANPSLIAQSDSARQLRTQKEIEQLKEKYHMSDDQQAIRRYKEIYDSNTTVLEKAERSHRINFIDNPPLTLDDKLDYQVKKLPGNIPMVSSIFNTMSGATAGIAINLDGVPQQQLWLLSLFPELLTQTGVIRAGKAISYEDMTQMLQYQILDLSSSFSTNGATGRVELMVSAAGNNTAEAQRGVGWIEEVLQHPNWSISNLPRIRDLVEQQLSFIRKRMQGPEESWVRDPGNAFVYQDNPLYLTTSSFLTMEYNIFRLKWRLKDAGAEGTRSEIVAFLGTLANASGGRQDKEKLLSLLNAGKDSGDYRPGMNAASVEAFQQLSSPARLLAEAAATDLEQLLHEIPDNSLQTDWRNLCVNLGKDLSVAPEKTLTDLNHLRKSILKKDRARFFEIGSESTEKKLSAGILKIVSGLDGSPTVRQHYAAVKLINERVKARLKTGTEPVFVGLVNPDSPTGVFINTAPIASYRDTTREELLKFLAAELYGGAGKQSVYTKSTGAGLSYSTGIGVNPGSGTMLYYAERTPLLPQTLRFVIQEVKRAPEDTTLLDYVVSLAVGSFRSASEYEVRGESMAADLADGLTPDVVKGFRLAILKLRKEPGLIHKIYQYKDEVYEKILPGYGIPSGKVAGGNYFVIGAEKQMEAYEAYLKSVDGNQTQLFRLYPRDYWMVH